MSQKKGRTSCTTGRWPYIARKLKNLKSSQLPSSCTQIASNNFSGNFGQPKNFPENFISKAVWPHRLTNFRAKLTKLPKLAKFFGF